MPAKQQEPQPTTQEKKGCQQLHALIGRNVLHVLGQPGDFQCVHVRQLWGDRYRVNILAGEDSVSAKVAHSYFLVADSDGNVVESTPKLTKQY